MATSRRLLLLFSIFLALIFAEITAHSETTDDDDDDDDDYVSRPKLSDSSLKIQLDQLKSKISILESSIYERNLELKSKDENIKKLERIIQEKSAILSSLQNEIKSLQEKLSSYSNGQMGEAHARAGELEKQVDSLKKEIKTQNRRKDALEARANGSEKKIQELTLNLENLQRINNEQKTRIHKSQRTLQMAEEEMMKAKLEGSSISKTLIEVREAWLPSWLAVHLFRCQSFIATRWNQHGRPALSVTIQKALEKKAEVEKWAEPHFDKFKTEWIPTIKEHWLTFVTNIEPHMQSLTAKVNNVYHASRNSLQTNAVKLQMMMDPYFQEVKKSTKPYIDQSSTLMKPYVDKTRVILKPYTKKAVRSYKRFIKTVTLYHRQVQATIHEMLRNHEVMKPLATNELVWFLASALMALPLMFLLKMASAIFCKKPKKRIRTSCTSHARRRAKRVNPDK